MGGRVGGRKGQGDMVLSTPCVLRVFAWSAWDAAGGERGGGYTDTDRDGKGSMDAAGMDKNGNLYNSQPAYLTATLIRVVGLSCVPCL